MGEPPASGFDPKQSLRFLVSDDAAKVGDTTLEEAPIITPIVRFSAPEGVSLDIIAEAFRSTTTRYQGLPGLIRKYYLFDADAGTGGGVYLWESRQQAEAFYNAEWRNRLAEKYGSPPEISFFDTPVIVDNARDEVIVSAAE